MILADFTCPYHGRFEALVESDAESTHCPEPVVQGYRDEPNWVSEPCGLTSSWSPSPVHGRVRLAEVERGGVDKPDSPMYLDTRELGEGMPYEQFRAKRDKLYEERRHKESKEL